MQGVDFIPFEKHHLPLFMRWLRTPRVEEFWHESHDINAVEEKFLGELPARGVHSFIIRQDSKLVGYIQYYQASKIGKGYWPDEPPGTYGVDIIIGEPALAGKGAGTAAMREFLAFIKSRVPAKKVIIDPDPANTAAIKCFEKAGFRTEGEVSTPGGTSLLMSLSL